MKLLHMNFDMVDTGDVVFVPTTRQGSFSNRDNDGLYLSDQYASMSTLTDTLFKFMSNNNYTIDFWFYFAGGLDGPSDAYFFNAQVNSSNSISMYWDFSISKIVFNAQTGSIGGVTVIPDVATTIPSGWNHIAISYDKDATKYCLYLNGTRIKDTVYAPAASPGLPLSLTIGNETSTQDNSVYSYPFPNIIADFRISKITRWSDATYTVPTRPTVSDDDTLFLAKFPTLDKTNRNYVYKSTYQSSSVPAFLPVSMPGFGGCLQLDAFWYDSLYIGASSDYLFATEFTIEFWVCMRGDFANQWVISIGGYNLAVKYIDADSKLSAYFGTELLVVSSDDDSVPAGKWVHVVVIRDQLNTCNIAVDGVFSSSPITVVGNVGSASTGLTLASSAPNIGDSERGAFFIDDLLVWDTVQYLGDFTPPTAPQEI